MVKNDEIDKFVALYEEEIIKEYTRKTIRVKNLGSKAFMRIVLSNTMWRGLVLQGQERLSRSDSSDCP